MHRDGARELSRGGGRPCRGALGCRGHAAWGRGGRGDDARRGRVLQRTEPRIGGPVERRPRTRGHEPHHARRAAYGQARPARRSERGDRDRDLDIDGRRVDGSGGRNSSARMGRVGGEEERGGENGEDANETKRCWVTQARASNASHVPRIRAHFLASGVATVRADYETSANRGLQRSAPGPATLRSGGATLARRKVERCREAHAGTALAQRAGRGW